MITESIVSGTFVGIESPDHIRAGGRTVGRVDHVEDRIALNDHARMRNPVYCRDLFRRSGIRNDVIGADEWDGRGRQRIGGKTCGCIKRNVGTAEVAEGGDQGIGDHVPARCRRGKG